MLRIFCLAAKQFCETLNFLYKLYNLCKLFNNLYLKKFSPSMIKIRHITDKYIVPTDSFWTEFISP